MLQNIETNEGGPFGAVQKMAKKTQVKNTKIAKGGSLVCIQGSGRRF